MRIKFKLIDRFYPLQTDLPLEINTRPITVFIIDQIRAISMVNRVKPRTLQSPRETALAKTCSSRTCEGSRVERFQSNLRDRKRRDEVGNARLKMPYTNRLASHSRGTDELLRVH